MRVVKIIGISVAALAGLFGLALLVVWLFVDPNQYKTQIAAAVRKATGRELVLTGQLKLSVFPWLAVEAGEGTLGSPPGFGPESFLAWHRVALRARLWPLLHKRLEIGRVQIDGLDLKLRKNAAGQGNWEDFGSGTAGSEPANTGGSASIFGELAGIDVERSTISYEKMRISGLNVHVGRLTGHEAVPVKAELTLDTGPEAAQVGINADLSLTADQAAKQYVFKPISVTGTYSKSSGAKLHAWSFAASELTLDLQRHRLDLPKFTVGLASLEVNGGMSGTDLAEAMKLTGHLALAPVSPRTVMADLGMTPLDTQDPEALKSLQMSSNFAYGGDALRLTRLSATLDQTQIRGEAAIVSLKSMAMRFNLSVDRINVDRYLSPTKKIPDPNEKPFEVPTKELKGLDLNGTLAVAAAKLADIDFANVRLTVDSHGGVTRVFPSKAQLYGGQYSGDITLDGRAAEPVLKLDEHVSGIDMAKFLHQSMKSDRLSGRGNANARITGHGRNLDAIAKTLNGKVDADLVNGAVEGIDLWYELRRAQSLIKTHALPEGASTKRTKFDSFKASADIANGVASTKDLLIASEYLRVTGQGTTTLATKAIDYKLVATVLKTPPSGAGELGELKSLEIPVAVGGTLTDPKVRPDLEGIAKAKVRQKVDEKKEELKQKLQEKLQDKLKGLFAGGR